MHRCGGGQVTAGGFQFTSHSMANPPPLLLLLTYQARFFQLVCSETFLVGHSLENDLKALRVVHSRVLDTALLFPHPKVGQ